MPRQSVEARAAAAWRTGRVTPEPPSYLSARGKSLWLDILASKPPDWFDAGSLPLLAMYVVAIEIAEDLAVRRSGLPSTPENDKLAARLERRHQRAIVAMVQLATKCRLSVQAAVDRRSRMLDERGSPPHPLLSGRDH